MVDCCRGHGVKGRVGDERKRETISRRAWEEAGSAAGVIVLSRLLRSFYNTFSHNTNGTEQKLSTVLGGT